MGLRDYPQCVLHAKLHCTDMTEGNLIATYSNLENHPRLIRARQVRTTPKITLDPKTGLPLVDGEKVQKRTSRRQIEPIAEIDEDERRKFIHRIFVVQDSHSYYQLFM